MLPWVYIWIMTSALIISLDVSAFVIGGILSTVVVLAALLIYFGVRQYNNAIQGTQELITDKELIEHIHSVPDKIIRVKELKEMTGMSGTQASYRLQMLSSNHILRALYTDGFKTYYTLRSEIDDRPIPSLSSAPFLTTEDILVIMKHYDYKVSMANFVMATGLPVYILKKELNYFIKEKMITKLTSFDANGIADGVGSVYILREPYRSNPDSFLKREKEIDLHLESLYDHSYNKDIV